MFDAEWYLEQYPDVAQLGMDPIIHYLWIGAALGRDPSPRFSTTGYLRVHRDVAAAGVNPLIHYVGTGQYESRELPSSDDSSEWVPSKAGYCERISNAPPRELKARLIAFYLPQFHPIPENDEWWGKGFTEWTNVRPASPQFAGHYQPHVPHADIGYYDLRDRDAQLKQIELAKAYGIGGFCFYYYWFGGKRLLETPIENYLADPELDHPFCLCWANENWSRRWDGLESEILIGQSHSAEDDVACIADIARFIRDPRYIRINGKPLLLVYRPKLLPSARETAARWRKWCRDNGIGEIYLAYTQSFVKTDPAEFGFDAAIEFPPNNSSPPDLTNRVTVFDDGYDGKVYDWDVFIEKSENYTDPGYTLFRSVCPGWDNTARRGRSGTAFVNNSPAKYQLWLENAVNETVRAHPEFDERLIFVNAWNEWAEGAHLEPDQETGYAYLEATRRALTKQDSSRKRIILVAHDAYRHGAQYLSLNLAKLLSTELDYDVDMLVLGDGPLKNEFAKWAKVHDLAGCDPAGQDVRDLIIELRGLGARAAIVNTTVSAAILPALSAAGLRTVVLIHEMPAVIRQMGLEKEVEDIARHSDTVIFASTAVQDGFCQFAKLPAGKCIVRPQGLYKVNPLRRITSGIDTARRALRKRLGLPADAAIVLGVGYADYRKGPDLFIEAGLKLLEEQPATYFIWLGNEAGPDWMAKVHAPALAADKMDRFLFLGLIEETDDFYAGADVFALTSREDPYPSVVLEAMDCGLPVVAFAGTGGMEELIREAGGFIVPAFDAAVYANALGSSIDSHEVRTNCFDRGTALIDGRFAFRQYGLDLLRYANEKLPRVSVIIPNYNYARYIEGRLRSVFEQTYPIYELIVLDDNSSDDSVARIKHALKDANVPHRLVVNEENSGSVFRQWQKGVELARGDLIWIAEADDLAHPDFLASTVARFEPGVVMSYCQSRQIDEHGTVLSANYLNYVADLGAERWQTAYRASGNEEIAHALFLKNTIPNVSAVVFDRQALKAMLDAHGEEIMSYRNAGDWVAYLRLLEAGDIAFTPEALNDHRRHSNSVTIGNANQRHLDEIMKVQRMTISRHRFGSKWSTRASDYARSVAKHFGLPDEAASTVEAQERL
jgi:glycosyltransferase involved in cell wall biosynthesis